jgi:uncharacterized membrane protein
MSSLGPILQKITENILTPIISVLFALAFVIFVYGIFGMIASPEDSDKRKHGQDSILWGVVGMFIMISVFGILRLIAATVGVNSPL